MSRLQLSPTLRRTLRSTNPIESMIGTCRTTARNVKRYRSGKMTLRWIAAGMVEAEEGFRRQGVPRHPTADGCSRSPPRRGHP